jgi:cobalt-zinc-cadmium efflux system outer membrane protein
MSMRWAALICVSLLVAGCRTPDMESIDQTVSDLSAHPFDVAPPHLKKPVDAGHPAVDAPPPADAPTRPGEPQALPPAVDAPAPAAALRAPAAAATGRRLSYSRPARLADNVVRASLTQPGTTAPDQDKLAPQKFQLAIPPGVPGSETPAVTVPSDPERRPAAVARLFPQLPPLPEEPVPAAGPDGRPYTLADLHQMAAANNPALRQAVSDIEAARGVLKQSITYPNPTIGYETNPDNNNTGSGVQGFFVDQVIKTGGKLTLAGGTAAMNLRSAELALKRARSDLATTIRGDYYTLLVAKETVRVNRALAQFTDEIFRLQADLLGGGFAASHEPAALRSQAFIVRLAYAQAVQNYIYAWKQLVADIGLRQLPLSQVEGEIDRLIPYYDYDEILPLVLHNHTDVLTARYSIRGADYSLKLARVTPFPDVEVRGDLWKEHMIQPFQNYYTLSVSIPFPIWDQNKGNIRAAAAAMVRAVEQPHAVEVNLTTNLATAYATYKTNLFALDYYRRNILPDQVRYYRGVFERRRIDPNVAFGDLVQAQQTLVADVTSYLGILSSLWTSVVGVADFLQTDDLFQFGKRMELPRLPNIESYLEGLHDWPCPHSHEDLSSAPGDHEAAPTLVPATGAMDSPAPTQLPFGAQRVDSPNATAAAVLTGHAADAAPPAVAVDRALPLVELPSGASAAGKSLRENWAKLLGAVESPFGAPTSVAGPVELSGLPFAQDLGGRSTAASPGSSP